jgi:hypothetical protein
VSEWKPFETAPKDGKKYIFWKNGDITTAWWQGGRFGGNGWCYELPDNIDAGFTKNLPTHWDYMPPPPTA